MKRRYQIFILTIFSLSIIFISCSDLKKDLSTATNSISHKYSPYDCTTCHGGVNAAPPKALNSDTTISSPGVGAHQSHLLASHSIGAAVACNECHVVPAIYDAPGHIDSTPGAEILFRGKVVTSNLAALAGSNIPTYSHTTLKCDNTYCHGYFPNGNKVSPSWTDGSGRFRACGSCHGDPSQTTIGNKALPKISVNGGFHPNNTQCFTCHPTAINASYQLNPSMHVNGKIDF